VGRPPQEDTSFGQLIHEITGEAIPKEIPGLKEVHAVDAAGVHPLLLAIGSERYTPYAPAKQPAEILTIANHVLGTGQLSLAKYLFITADDTNRISTHDIEAYLTYILERIKLERDIHFHTNTTIDTLDYSGSGLNSGSKVVIAAYGDKIRELQKEVPQALRNTSLIQDARMIMPGVVAIQTSRYTDPSSAAGDAHMIGEALKGSVEQLQGTPLFIWCDDASFTAANLRNFLWVSFTRSNPSHDIYGIDSFQEFKHWGCRGPMIIDARIKPHHAPPVVSDPAVEKKIDRIFSSSGSLASLNA
jgi:4-hydroxy-3-polyprenylbenzoate decarboxylase